MRREGDPSRGGQQGTRPRVEAVGRTGLPRPVIVNVSAANRGQHGTLVRGSQVLEKGKGRANVSAFANRGQCGRGE
eukprot:5107948-Pyramimonas_sp.AAC.2